MLNLFLLCLTLLPISDTYDEISQCITGNSAWCFRDIADNKFSPRKLIRLVTFASTQHGLCLQAKYYFKEFQECFENGDPETRKCFKNKFGVFAHNAKDIFELYLKIVENTRDYLCYSLTLDETYSLRKFGVICLAIYQTTCQGFNLLTDFPHGLMSDQFWSTNQTEVMCKAYTDFLNGEKPYSALCIETTDFVLGLSRSQLNDVICNITKPFNISPNITWKSGYIFIVLISYLLNKLF